MTRRALLAVVVLAGATFVGCGDDGDVGPDLSPPDMEALSGNAPAAQGAGLDTPPGPADRLALDSFDVGDLEFGEVAIAITGPNGEVAGWCVLLAATSEQRQRGLMEVTDLGGYAGMLFVWDGDASSSFYMRNTPMPLSIGWFDADGGLVSTADMDPCPDVEGCPTYPSGGTYRFALEVPQGSLGDVGVAGGSSLAVGGPCAERTSRTTGAPAGERQSVTPPLHDPGCEEMPGRPLQSPSPTRPCSALRGPGSAGSEGR